MSPAANLSEEGGEAGRSALSGEPNSDVVVHPEPLWRDRSNFIVFADIHHPRMPRQWEQLWTRKLDEERYEICCVPFFVYDIALGDQVMVGPQGGKRYVVQKVVLRSGRFAFRLWFDQSPKKLSRDEMVHRLTDLGGQLEPYSDRLLALDAPDKETAQRISDYLAERESAGDLIYETARRGGESIGD